MAADKLPITGLPRPTRTLPKEQLLLRLLDVLGSMEGVRPSNARREDFLPGRGAIRQNKRLEKIQEVLDEAVLRGENPQVIRSVAKEALARAAEEGKFLPESKPTIGVGVWGTKGHKKPPPSPLGFVTDDPRDEYPVEPHPISPEEPKWGQEVADELYRVEQEFKAKKQKYIVAWTKMGEHPTQRQLNKFNELQEELGALKARRERLAQADQSPGTLWEEVHALPSENPLRNLPGSMQVQTSPVQYDAKGKVIKGSSSGVSKWGDLLNTEDADRVALAKAAGKRRYNTYGPQNLNTVFNMQSTRAGDEAVARFKKENPKATKAQLELVRIRATEASINRRMSNLGRSAGKDPVAGGVIRGTHAEMTNDLVRQKRALPGGKASFSKLMQLGEEVAGLGEVTESDMDRSLAEAKTAEETRDALLNMHEKIRLQDKRFLTRGGKDPMPGVVEHINELYKRGMPTEEVSILASAMKNAYQQAVEDPLVSEVNWTHFKLGKKGRLELKDPKAWAKGREAFIDNEVMKAEEAGRRIESMGDFRKAMGAKFDSLGFARAEKEMARARVEKPLPTHYEPRDSVHDFQTGVSLYADPKKTPRVIKQTVKGRGGKAEGSLTIKTTGPSTIFSDARALKRAGLGYDGGINQQFESEAVERKKDARYPDQMQKQMFGRDAGHMGALTPAPVLNKVAPPAPEPHWTPRGGSPNPRIAPGVKLPLTNIQHHVPLGPEMLEARPLLTKEMPKLEKSAMWLLKKIAQRALPGV